MAEDDEQLVTVVVGEQPLEAPEPEQPPMAQWPADEVCAAAVEIARDALLEEVPADHVGDSQGLSADGPLVVTHYFDGRVPGYSGWHWAVTVTRAPDSDLVTVDETALLPGADALLAPPWLPWTQRIQSGDLGAGDVMVTEADDPRLMPGMSQDDVPDPEDDLLPPLWERGLGRERMLSPEGLREAAHRWYRELGPRSTVARATDLPCQTCGFLLLIGGPLGQAFGVCANGFSPADGRVVALNFGCGAHSQTPPTMTAEVAGTVIDELGYQDVESIPDPPEDVEPVAEAAEPADGAADEQPAEPEASDEQAPEAAQPEAEQPDEPKPQEDQ